MVAEIIFTQYHGEFSVSPRSGVGADIALGFRHDLNTFHRRNFLFKGAFPVRRQFLGESPVHRPGTGRRHSVFILIQHGSGYRHKLFRQLGKGGFHPQVFRNMIGHIAGCAALVVQVFAYILTVNGYTLRIAALVGQYPKRITLPVIGMILTFQTSSLSARKNNVVGKESLIIKLPPGICSRPGRTDQLLAKPVPLSV